MKIAVMQPYLFPYMGYWQLMDAVDVFVIFDDVNYIKKGYINRNSILVGGGSYKFTLELKKASQNKLINEIEVGSNREQLFKTISLAYAKAPSSSIILPLLDEIFGHEDNNLARFVGNSLITVSRYLDMDIEFLYSSEISKNNSLKGQDKIIDIAKVLGATDYINSIGGRDLYLKDDFRKENINLKFIESEAIKYRQFDRQFIPGLSIIDVLMFNSLKEVKIMLGEYRLV